MPDLRHLLSAAAQSAQPGNQPPFGDLQRRARRRVHRRRSAGVVVAAVLAAGTGVIVASHGTDASDVPTAAPSPCVTPFPEGGRDVFAAIPASGTSTVSVVAGGALTLGWVSCTESGTVTSTDTQDRYLTDDVKGHVLHGAPHAKAPVTPQQRFRYFAYEAGTVTLTGSGSEGSHGSLVVTIRPLVEPVGASLPSPFPYTPPHSGVTDICDVNDPADADGRLTRSISYSDTNVMAPPGAVPSKYTRAQTLARYAASEGSYAGNAGHAKAYFGLLTADTPAHINPDGSTTPFYQRTPVWLVAVCDLPEEYGVGHSGPMRTGPTPAPGTSPSPGAHGFGVVLVPYDESGKALYISGTGRTTAEQRAQRFIDVPFTRTRDDSADGRQIGISYGDYEPCATFSHLDVLETDTEVHVRVWLRLLGDDDTCRATGSRQAVVGLRVPLGDRALVRGSAGD